MFIDDQRRKRDPWCPDSKWNTCALPDQRFQLIYINPLDILESDVNLLCHISTLKKYLGLIEAGASNVLLGSDWLLEADH